MIFFTFDNAFDENQFFLHGPADTFDVNLMFSCLCTIDDKGLCRY